MLKMFTISPDNSWIILSVSLKKHLRTKRRRSSPVLENGCLFVSTDELVYLCSYKARINYTDHDFINHNSIYIYLGRIAYECARRIV